MPVTTTAYSTYKCNRCGRRESTPADIRKVDYFSRILPGGKPEGWGVTDCEFYCPTCAAAIQDVLAGLQPRRTTAYPGTLPGARVQPLTPWSQPQRKVAR